MGDVLRFDCGRKQVDVILTIDGKEKKCVLRELLGGGRNDYLEEVTKGMDIQLGPDGKPKSITKPSMGKLQTLMLTLCLHDENDKLFTAEEIEKLPNRVREALHTKAEEMSTFSEESMKKVGNA